MEVLDNTTKERSKNTEDDEIGSSNGKMYIPQVSDELKPKKGQQFGTLEDVFNFYNTYAKASGFSVRSWTTNKERRSDVIRRKEYVCWKEGKPKRIVNAENKRRRGSIGEECKAKIAVLKSNSSKKYIVTVFNEVHTHPLSSPEKTHLLPSHRNVSSAVKSSTKKLSAVNIPQHQRFSFPEVQSGGIENIEFPHNDAYKHERGLPADMQGHDGKMFHEYLKLEQEKNPSFTFKIETDDEQQITRCFWSDATSRRAYKFYGDVVIFDTTYNTNRYGLIFAPIIGVNNHGQTVFFGCGFLKSKTIDDFIWLFNQFLVSMPCGAPKMIVTDHDPTTTRVFPLVFPMTFHRYCSWHILMKFSKNIDSATYSIYKNDFLACIWESERPEEFDREWKSLIEKSGLGKNNWLQEMYEIRAKWVPAYVNHMFSANMSSSQQAESIHAFFKRFVSKNNSLVDFMIQFGKALVRQRQEELKADHKDEIEKPKIRINHDFLVQMVDIYTNEMFYKFEDELCNSFNYSFQLLDESENHGVYQIKRRNSETSKVREIIYDKDLEFASCTCKKFDSIGIPCRHVIAYLMKFDDLDKLPDKYILKRWTKSSKLRSVVDYTGGHILDENSYKLMRSQFIQSCLDLVDKALLYEETRKIFYDGLRSINDKIDQFISNRSSAKACSEKSNPIATATSAYASSSVENSCNEPDLVRPKGCGIVLMGEKEKAKNGKVRRCHGCGNVGQAHDRRNCPALAIRSSAGKKNPNLEESSESSKENGDES